MLSATGGIATGSSAILSPEKSSRRGCSFERGRETRARANWRRGRSGRTPRANGTERETTRSRDVGRGVGRARTCWDARRPAPGLSPLWPNKRPFVDDRARAVACARPLIFDGCERGHRGLTSRRDSGFAGAAFAPSRPNELPRRRIEAEEDFTRPRALFRAFLGRDGDARDGGQPHGRRAQIQREHLHRSVPRATRRAAVPGRLVRPPIPPRASSSATDVPFLPRAPPALPSATNNGKPSAPA